MEDAPTRSIVPLHEVSRGTEVVIHDLQGGKQFLSRLATLGFTPGARLTMQQNFGHGPVIVCLHDARIALGRGEAGRVRVIVQNHANR